MIAEHAVDTAAIVDDDPDLQILAGSIAEAVRDLDLFPTQLQRLEIFFKLRLDELEAFFQRSALSQVKRCARGQKSLAQVESYY